MFASLALLLCFACKDVLCVEKQQLVWNHAVPCSESLTIGANIPPVTGNLQDKLHSRAFVSSRSALGWWLHSAICEDKYRRSYESECITRKRAGREFCKVNGGIAAVRFSHSQM